MMKYLLLKDVCSINMGQSPNSDSYNDDKEGVPFFQGNADFGDRYPVTRKWCSEPTKIAMPEDILISVRAPIGSINYAKEKCCIGRGLAAITPNNEKVSKEFIFWLLISKNNELNSKGTGSTFKAINRKVLEEVLVPDIPLCEQQRYADILEKIYGIIQNKSLEILKFGELVKSRFIELVGDPRINPNNYEIKKISELYDVGSSKRVFESEWTNSGAPFYRAREIVKLSKDGYVDNELFISNEMYEKYKNKYGVPRAGDIMVTGVGTLGICYIVKETDKFYFKDGNTLWFKNKGICNSRFIKDQFETDYVKEQIDANANASTVGTYTITKANDTRVIVPPDDVQNEYVSFVEKVDKSKFICQQKINLYQELLDKKMDEYFNPKEVENA